LRNDAGAETSGGSRRNPAIEDEPDFLWLAEVEILTDDVLEEEAAVLGLVEDLGKGELGLQDGNLVAAIGLAIRSGEGMRQSGQPLAQQGVDLVAGEVVADLLQARGVGAALDAVVERLEGNASVGELALGVLMAIEVQLGIERKIAAELQEERAEIPLQSVDVIVVHHGGEANDPRIGLAGLGVGAPLGPEHRGFLLGLADKNHSFVLRELAKVLRYHVVFALDLAKLHDRNPMLRRKSIQRRHEGATHRAHQRRRRHRLATVLAEKPRNSLFHLQPGHIDVEVHPVDPFDREPDVIGEDIGHTLCYHRNGSGCSVLPACRRLDRLSVPLSPELVMNRRSGPQNKSRSSLRGSLSLTRLRLRPTRHAATYPHDNTPRRSEAEPR
jgi:hypothetical protein